MNFLQFNTRSLDTSTHYIKDYIINNKTKILALSEIWNPKEEKTLKNIGFTPHSLVRSSQHGGGVALYIHKSVKSLLRPDLTVPDLEAVWAEVMIGTNRTLIASVYIPPGNQAQLKKFRNILQSLSTNLSLLIMGDFNCRNESWESWHSNHRTKSGAHTMGNQLIDICAEFGLTVLNDGNYTREVNGVKSAPDVTLGRNLPSVSWTSDHLTRLNSDHLPIKISFKSPIHNPVTRWNIRKVDWPDWKNATNASFQELMNKSENLSASQMAEDLTNNLLGIAKGTWLQKKVCQHSKAFWCENLSKLKLSLKKARKPFELKGDPFSYSQYKVCVKAFAEEYEKQKDKNWKDLCSQMEYKDPQFWRKLNDMKSHGQQKTVIQPMVNPDGTANFDDQGIAKILLDTHIQKEKRTDHQDDEFDKLVNEAIISEDQEPSNNDEDHNTVFKIGEITNALKSF